MRILLVSGFFESQLPSYREYSYSKELALLGHEVTLMCGNQSQIWRFSRTGLAPTSPSLFDTEFVRNTGVHLVRRKIFFRVSDFVLYVPSLAAIWKADVVHVIEFRQGVTLLAALLARILNKPIVYDHEQRGDRSGFWYNSIDNAFRRSLVFIGSWVVDCVRHTVLANRDHFNSCSVRKVKMVFAPLGTDPGCFFWDSEARVKVRNELGLSQKERVAVMSGKLHSLKRVPDVVRACRIAGIRLILIGSLTDRVKYEVDALGVGSEIRLALGDTSRLRAVYCAADVAIFTTFTLSYWEAYATGIQLVVPDTAFSNLVFHDDRYVARFGSQNLFRVSDEEYNPDVDLVPMLVAALSALPVQEQRTSRSKYSARSQAEGLIRLYEELAGPKSSSHAG